MGFVPYEEMGGEYERSSVLISPSPSETFGMAFHEARAFGLPILAVRAPYSEPFITPGRTGLLFGSVAELARGALELVRQPERLRDLAAAAAESRTAVVTTWAGRGQGFFELAENLCYSPARPRRRPRRRESPTKAMKS